MEDKHSREIEKGFSLIELMIAGSVMTFMAIGFSTMVTNQSKVINNMELKLQKNILATELTRVISDENQCTIMLNGKSLPPLGQPTSLQTLSIPSLPYSNLTSDGSPYNNGLHIGDMKIENISLSATPANQARVKIEIPFYAKTGNSKFDLKSQEFIIQTTVAANTITGCQSTSSCLDPDDGTYKTKRVDSVSKDTQICNQGTWLTTNQGCSRGGTFYPTGYTRSSGANFFRRGRKQICIDGNWASAGR